MYAALVGNLDGQNSGIAYYTGLSDYSHFKCLYFFLGPAADHLNYKNEYLIRNDELFFTLMKLRQNKSYIEIDITFTVHRTSVGKVFRTWMDNFMYYPFKEIDLFLGQ
uniref:Putative LOC101242628 [Ciona intestinalis] n=2 Tax=Lepeophtheirus salmonis TaxID=72036 RepID=A0A0K2V322_LEPSM